MGKMIDGHMYLCRKSGYGRHDGYIVTNGYVNCGSSSRGSGCGSGKIVHTGVNGDTCVDQGYHTNPKCPQELPRQNCGHTFNNRGYRLG